MSDVLLSVKGISKKYSKSLSKSLRYGLVDSGLEILNRRKSENLRESEFWAVKHVSFEVKRGECLALMGGNGAGKSTLLKTITGLLKPDAGEVVARGKLERLIEMSAGFNPHMTGLENIKMRAKLQGLSKGQLNNKIEEIIDFSELEEFIDSPYQTYSSGMKARLGFSVSTCFEPDILVVDEVLAVGDLGFRMKCYERIDELKAKTAMIFVSHSLGHISRLCDRGAYLEKGRMLHCGDTQTAIAMYQEKMGGNSKKSTAVYNADLIHVNCIFSNADNNTEDVLYGSPLDVGIKIDKTLSTKVNSVRVVLRDNGGSLIADWNSLRVINEINTDSIVCHIPALEFSPGRYALSVLVLGDKGQNLALSETAHFKITGQYLSAIPYQPIASWK